jgi:predicted RNase H-like nuclease
MIDAVEKPPAIAGVDGCAAGWLVVSEVGGQMNAWIAATIGGIVDRLPEGAVVAIDIPIGIPDRHDRACCKQARQLLGKRRSSVFTVPVRACLSAASYEQATALHREADGRGISKQAWGILAKIREVDTFLRLSKGPGVRIVEVHPEVSFARWGNAPMAYRKSKREGRAEREALIDRFWPAQRERLWASLGSGARRADLYDAFATLWTARRIARGMHTEMPDTPEYDAMGLPMRIVS